MNNVVLHNDGTATVKLKWYWFNQNNSGGRYVVDDVQAEDVFVQAINAKQAIAYIWDQLDHSYCHCCGERWTNWIDDEDGADHPEVYGEHIYVVSAKSSWDRGECRLHFYDGHIEKYRYGAAPIERLPSPVGAHHD